MKRHIGRINTLGNRCLILIIGILLIACQALESAPLPKEGQTLTETPANATEPVTSPLATNTQQPLSTPEPNSTDIALLPMMEPVELLTADFTSKSFQDLIIFTSLHGGSGPFANFQLNIHWADSTEPHLFAFSPDGRRAGALTPINYASSIYLPPNRSEKPKLVAYGVEFDHPAVQGIELPPECYQPVRVGERFLPCSQFQFSLDGRYLGFFYGPTECLRAIIIQDTQTGVQVYHSMQANGHYFSLLDNGKAIIATGHCEGGSVSLYDLDYRVGRQLGEEGSNSWNVDKSAFVVETGSYAGISSTVWGFNFETNQLFLNVPETRQIDDHPVWTPDKQYLLYQHRTFSRASDGFTATGFDKPRQILLVDAQSGKQRTLLSNAGYDFHLGSCWNCEEWFGDWIQVRRVAFVPENVSGGDEIYRTQQYTCRIYGQNCSTPVDLFALNWKTSELVAWNEFIQSGLVPNMKPTETAGPDLEKPIYEHPQGRFTLYAGPKENTFWVYWKGGAEGGSTILSGPDFTTMPIYEHSSGLYAFYIGIDGKTLWMVPDEGTPLPRVLDGQNYFYLGKK